MAMLNLSCVKFYNNLTATLGGWQNDTVSHSFFCFLDPTLSSLIAEKLSENSIRISWDVNSTGGADITSFTVSIILIQNNSIMHWENERHGGIFCLMNFFTLKVLISPLCTLICLLCRYFPLKCLYSVFTFLIEHFLFYR